MSVQTSPSSVLEFRRPARRSGRRLTTDPQLLIAAALFIAVLIADALFIAAAAPRLADIASLYITTT